jgi:carbon storage regulator CsrA
VLVLTRKAGEVLKIGAATVVVLDINKFRGKPQVRLGISAPRDLRVVRGEHLVPDASPASVVGVDSETTNR